MPVTLITAEHPSNAWRYPKVPTAEELFEYSCREEHRRCQNLIQDSYPTNLFNTSHISPSEHGFVWAAVHAYKKSSSLDHTP
ncbi:hypothetical protein N7481_000075 [Penicillium waksmanii]|uniref:uncharacterized protein n=1 Tax=Penicillium waksmanii TaxID=69791 RepID=UPI00254918AB|nr:uncharacterized protein N7481_000075 [Penicillium waksmanii]KAJ5999666.1 hypothetical protein N7481_000075 [Penicillium waksmanii]